MLKLHRSSAPRRPPRIMLMGPPGCGKSQHARKIAEKYNIAYIKVSHMIKDIIRQEANSLKAKDLKSRLSTANPCKLINAFSNFII